MKPFSLITLAAVLSLSVLSCRGNLDEGNTGDGGLELSASLENIIADGNSSVSFSVKYNGNDVSSSAKIISLADNKVMDGNRFSSTVAGTFSFKAEYNELSSNIVKITVTAPGEGLRMLVDKSSIEADGKDIATIQVIDKDGTIVTDDSSLLKYVSFYVVETGETFARTNEFSSIANGTYTLQAKYKADFCSNTVKVKVVNRGKYEKYFHMIPIYDITNIQCTACPSLAEGLESIPAPYSEHALVLAVHGNFSNNDPFLRSDIANGLFRSFGLRGAYPSVIYNLVETDEGSSGNPVADAEEARDFIRQQMIENPATCGVKLTTSYDRNSGMAKIKVSMMPVKAAKYDIGCAILLDNQDVSALSPYFSEINDIVLNITGNYAAMSNEAFDTTVDEEVSKEWDVVMSSDVVDAYGGIDNFRVVGFVLCEDGDNVRFDNAAVCPLGEDIDYKLN